ncbi:MAG TPA: hypothetical protein PLE78_04570 [Flavobacteriales bacterium]|nr:hypothetical protein [Flavobacteriales bacterium]HQV74740.1 hypothetical protein [Flavobacteriales bacterium]HQW41603.1 hypothetical protein [Flavobacteriales bacterium]
MEGHVSDPEVKEQTWPGTLMVFGIFTLLLSFWWVGEKTLISYTALGRWFALFAFAGNLLSYKGAGLRLGMERLEWFLFNLLAVGPLLFSAALWVNMLVHGPEQLQIVQVHHYGLNVKRYWIDHGVLPPGVPIEKATDLAPLAGQKNNVLGTAKGCLGYVVITRWEGADSEKLEPVEGMHPFWH